MPSAEPFSPWSPRLDGHDVSRGTLAPLQHLAHEELCELSPVIAHRARCGVHQLRVGDFGHAGLERRASGRERTRTGVHWRLLQPCAVQRCSRILGFRCAFGARVRVPSTPPTCPVHPSAEPAVPTVEGFPTEPDPRRGASSVPRCLIFSVSSLRYPLWVLFRMLLSSHRNGPRAK